MKRNGMWAMIGVALLLPACALAVTEGVVEAAPPVLMAQIETQEIAYLPDESYYAGSAFYPSWEQAQTWVENEFDGEYYSDTSQNPCLTAGEAVRAEKLLEDYHSGKAAYTGESVLEKMEDVIVGVYALDPADYDGEHAYVILPGTCLTDDQLLSMIAAFDELGLTFDPSGLNYRNCTRGGGIETNRFFSDEERIRYADMGEWIRRGRLVAPEGTDGLIRNPMLDSRYFCGLTDFSIKPYRSMTDEELVSLLVAIGIHDERGEIDHNEIEARSRNTLYTAFGCPLSMNLNGVYNGGSYVPYEFTADGKMGVNYAAKARESYGANFTYYIDGDIRVYAGVTYDKETGEIVFVDTMHDRDHSMFEFQDEAFGATQEKIDAAIASVEQRLNLSGLEWHVMMDDITSTNWGACIPVRALVADDCLFTLYIGYGDGQEHGMELTYGELVEELLPWDWEDEGNG